MFLINKHRKIDFVSQGKRFLEKPERAGSILKKKRMAA